MTTQASLFLIAGPNLYEHAGVWRRQEKQSNENNNRQGK